MQLIQLILSLIANIKPPATPAPAPGAPAGGGAILSWLQAILTALASGHSLTHEQMQAASAALAIHHDITPEQSAAPLAALHS